MWFLASFTYQYNECSFNETYEFVRGADARKPCFHTGILQSNDVEK
jgi:hypothetical protein